MQCTPIDSDQFIAVVRPALERRDAEELAELVKVHWDKQQLCELLCTGTPDARKVVCLTLGLVGCEGCCDCLAGALHDDDPVVCDLAEHALWSIWFRAGSPEASGPFRHGLELMEQQQFAEALAPLSEALSADPQFAEAYNQRSIARYMLEHWAEAIADARQAVAIAPSHFGAVAGMGHCYAQMGKLSEAARCYRDALEIHPRLPVIGDALKRIEQRLQVPA